MERLFLSSFAGIGEGFNGEFPVFAPSLPDIVDERCGSQPLGRGRGGSAVPAGGIGGLPKSVGGAPLGLG